MCEGRGGRPGLPVPNSLYGLCGHKATLLLLLKLLLLSIELATVIQSPEAV